MTASHFLVVGSRRNVSRYDLDFTRQKSGYYGPDRSRPRDDGRSPLPGDVRRQRDLVAIIRILLLDWSSQGDFWWVPSCQLVSMSSLRTHWRSEHPDPNFFLPPPQPYAGSGDLIGVGRYSRRRNLSGAACYRKWPLSR